MQPTLRIFRRLLVVAGFALSAWPAARAQAGNSIKIPLADGFDIPVGKPDGDSYYVFRGYSPNGHLGEDWNGNSGGNSDLGDPVYSSGEGVVVFSDDYKRGWGNVVIVRHAYLDESGRVALMDSLYGHLDKRTVVKYQKVRRGDQLGTIGTAHGKYWAHLHFEMRKNLQIGMNRSAFAKDYSNYFSPRQFIAPRRHLRAGAMVVVPVDTFSSAAPGQEDEGPEKNPALTRNSAAPDTPSTARQSPDRRVSREDASASREDRLQKLIEENRKKVDTMRDDDLDKFWDRLRKKLK